MPRCEGRPDGPCPDKRNDDTVRGTQGDLMLCHACDEYRFPPKHDTRSSKTSRQSAPVKVSVGKKDAQGGTITSTLASEVGPSTVCRDGAASSRPIDIDGPKLVVSELLSYVCYHRNSCSQAALVRVICCFFTASEITAAKKCLVGFFRDLLLDTGLTTDRRASTSRPAHEADLDDVIAIIDYLDSKDLLSRVTFAAVNLSRLPGYAPEETNLCSVVDRHVELNAVVTQLAADVKSLSGQSAPSVQQLAQVHVDMLDEVKKTVDQIDNKLDLMQNVLTDVSGKVCTTGFPARHLRLGQQLYI